MDNSFWHERWKNNQIGFHQEEISNHLQQHWPTLKAAAGSSVFVPLCGKSKDMLWLRAQGYQVIGVEISPIAVKDFFSENDLQPSRNQEKHFERYEIDGLTLLCGDFFNLGAKHIADCKAIYDRASLIALPPEMRKAYVEKMHQIQPADCTTLLVTLEYPQSEMQGPPFSVKESEVMALYPSINAIDSLLNIDILAENPQFEKKGLSSLREHIYLIQPT